MDTSWWRFHIYSKTKSAVMKKIFIFLSLFLFNSHISAEIIASKLSGNFKIEGSASIEVHSTPLVDEKILKNLKKNCLQL